MKAVVSVSQQCRLLQMSRSQFYWHVKKGTFHAPLRLASNNRPYFTASMVEDNVKVRETGIAVSGEYVIFYERQARDAMLPTREPRSSHPALIEGLKSLGLTAITREQVESALAACFPRGSDGQDETTVLRTVFRYIKRSGAA